MKIVLTGGPSAGKTSVVDILERTDPLRLVIVPEAASILFRGGFPRAYEAPLLKCQQRAIYAVQRELETIGSLDPLGRHLICDRGSLDALAYWPGSAEDFYSAVGTTLESEIARYDLVVHLDTAAPANYRSDVVRVENEQEAYALNQKVKTAWKNHPRRLIVPNATNFLTKADTVKLAVDGFIDGQSFEQLRTELALFED